MFDKPNTTPFPDDLIDKDLRNLSGAETKVLMLIVRKTLGFQKYWDYISTSQIEEYTGLSNRGVIDSIIKLEKNNFIVSEYICCKCGIITSFQSTKRGIHNDFQCKRCGTREFPNKWYALSIKGEDVKKHLKEVLKIAMERISASAKGYEKSSQPRQKGYEKSSQQVMRKVHIQDPIYKIHKKGSSSSSLNTMVPGPHPNLKNEKNEEEEFFLQKIKAEEMLKRLLNTKYTQCAFLDEDLTLIGKHEEYRIERVAKTALRRKVDVKMMPEYILNGLLNFDSLYKDKKGKHLDTPPGLIEHEKFKEQASNAETVKNAFNNIFSMLDEKKKDL